MLPNCFKPEFFNTIRHLLTFTLAVTNVATDLELLPFLRKISTGNVDPIVAVRDFDPSAKISDEPDHRLTTGCEDYSRGSAPPDVHGEWTHRQAAGLPFRRRANSIAETFCSATRRRSSEVRTAAKYVSVSSAFPANAATLISALKVSDHCTAEIVLDLISRSAITSACACQGSPKIGSPSSLEMTCPVCSSGGLKIVLPKIDEDAVRSLLTTRPQLRGGGSPQCRDALRRCFASLAEASGNTFAPSMGKYDSSPPRP